MSFLQRALVSVTAAFIFALFCADAAPEVDANCLGCLCEAASKCNTNTKCHVPYGGAYFCGPFGISWAYWADAGKPVLQHDNPDKLGAFENCAQDLPCAADVVRKYMKKFGKDCDGDGVVSCNDYVRIHKLGRNACTGSLPSDLFRAQFEECAARLNVF